MVYIHNGIFLSHKEEKKIMAFAGKWMKLDNTLSEIGQAQKAKGQKFPLITRRQYIMREGGGVGEEKNKGTLEGVREKWMGEVGERKMVE